MLLVSPVPVVVATGEVTWYLRDTDASEFSYPPGHVADKLMTRESPTNTMTQSVALAAGEEAWWYTDQVAHCDLSFPSGTWTVTFWAGLPRSMDPDTEKNLTLGLQKVCPDGSATLLADEEFSVPACVDQKCTRDLDLDTAITVAEDERLAFSFGWDDSASSTITIRYDTQTRNSRLTSPPESPAWPVPEHATVLLLATGLCTLAGFALVARRRGR